VLADQNSYTERTVLYVRLLDEGTEVARPTDAFVLGNGLYI